MENLFYSRDIQIAAYWACCAATLIGGHTPAVISGMVDMLYWEEEFPGNEPFPVDGIWIPKTEKKITAHEAFELKSGKTHIKYFFEITNPLDLLYKLKH